VENIELDSTDWKILALLQENGRATYSDIALKVNLTPPAVAKRIQRLEDAQILRGYHAEINLERLGYPIICFVNLEVPGRMEEKVVRFLSEKPQVLECYLIAGQNTFIIKVAAQSINLLNSFLNELVSFGQCTTFIVLSQVITQRTISK
jgi:Lrp/AsnC family transcriptional regulator, leucine-responsive regulatory protein